ncbi:endolysin [Streptomyces phage Miek]|nr:hydrolase [Streptomyces phage SendItCS]WIC89341.1 endolysin [Streptomyces phage Miek]
MTATIAYDRTVSNLIDELSATGHVTHRSYKKTSVTLHHNAGRLSHQGVLNVWKTRPASAHFDVDSAGAVAQYVKVNEYAWAAGNTKGNQTSIHIEMANSKLSPTWEVGDATWKGAARLAGWLFYKVIGARPTKDNLFYHSHWAATACAGPYMKKIYDDVLKEAQKAYDSFKKAPSSPSPSTPTKKTVDQLAKEVIAGKWNNGPARVRKLLAAGYDPEKVQARVDELMNPKRGPKSIKTLAAEVLAGKWGDDPSRSRDLKEAGYDPVAVQKEVNRQVRARR